MEKVGRETSLFFYLKYLVVQINFSFFVSLLNLLTF